MVRAMASHVPAHFTTVGIGTSVDPNGSGTMENPPPDVFVMKGGKMNQLSMSRGEDIVTDITLHGQRYLLYKVGDLRMIHFVTHSLLSFSLFLSLSLSLIILFFLSLFSQSIPINVALIRATTGDFEGNLSLEHESILCDQRNIAMVEMTRVTHYHTSDFL